MVLWAFHVNTGADCSKRGQACDLGLKCYCLLVCRTVTILIKFALRFWVHVKSATQQSPSHKMKARAKAHGWVWRGGGGGRFWETTKFYIFIVRTKTFGLYISFPPFSTSSSSWVSATKEIFHQRQQLLSCSLLPWMMAHFWIQSADSEVDFSKTISSKKCILVPRTHSKRAY